METTRDQREDHTTTEVTEVIRENEGPTETDVYPKAETSIYGLADAAINEADMLIIKSYFSGISRDEALESLNKIKIILDTIKRESGRDVS